MLAYVPIVRAHPELMGLLIRPCAWNGKTCYLCAHHVPQRVQLFFELEQGEGMELQMDNALRALVNQALRLKTLLHMLLLLLVKERKKEIPYKEGILTDIGAHVGNTVLY